MTRSTRKRLSERLWLTWASFGYIGCATFAIVGLVNGNTALWVSMTVALALDLILSRIPRRTRTRERVR